ncbi:hypothetical protein BST61_g9762 [Cercospora zeina]
MLSLIGIWTLRRSAIGSYGVAHTAGPDDIYNRTLGVSPLAPASTICVVLQLTGSQFQRVFAISMPERTDKRDGLLLASSYAGFDIDWHDGVAYSSISPKAVPPNWNYAKRSNGSLGCWRAHMNVLHTIVHQKIQSALIFEDDTDFDISIKQQLSQFAAGSRVLQNSTGRLSSPYGNDWDFLWLGHCKLGPGEEQSRLYVIDDDSTVPPLPHRNGKWYSDKIPPQVLEENKRIVFKATRGGLCMYAYAVTYESARKILTALSVVPRDDPVDMQYRHVCSGRYGVPIECYGSYPTLFATHRAAGPADRDSDLNSWGSKWHKEYTWDIVYSTIQNLPRLMTGNPYVQAQWPKDVKEEWKHISERLRGVGNIKNVDLKALPKEEMPGINR